MVSATPMLTPVALLYVSRFITVMASAAKRALLERYDPRRSRATTATPMRASSCGNVGVTPASSPPNASGSMMPTISAAWYLE